MLLWILQDGQNRAAALKGNIMENLPGEAINKRVFLTFLGSAESEHYYLYKFTPESSSFKI